MKNRTAFLLITVLLTALLLGSAAAEELSLEGYTLVWADEFDAPQLDRNSWNVELHEPGWVNAEWQAYVDSEDNIFMEDGKLVIRPIKTVDVIGTAHYTSGRVSTQNKRDFTYGIFEARLRVPEGVGYLPAFWLMATDENVYGQWPRCGEIDIMEVHGSATDTTYATLHYGNPHGQSQGSKALTSGSFSEDFHTYAVEWLPGEIRWYLDGALIHRENDWYSITVGQGEITYPAPFDQPFYMILNLAVGGTWVGYPDETTDFENARFEVDYVRVYQQDHYDEAVEKPAKAHVYREPDATGNYIINGDLAVAESLSDDESWTFLTAQGGVASASVKGNQLCILVEKSGSVDYSVQLVQPNLPMQKGGAYRVTFDAYATGDRTMLVGVSAPDLNYIRYMPDTLVALGTEKQTYTLDFTMTMDSDPNGRLEFNMGNAASTDDIFISNVRVEMTGMDESALTETKTVLADGNYLYNGNFQEGENRLGFWEIRNDGGAILTVTGFADGRRLSISGADGRPVVLTQRDLAVGEGAYLFSIDLTGPAGQNVGVTVAGQSFRITLEDGKTTYTNRLILGSELRDHDVELVFTGDCLVDNVTLTEDSILRNGSFNANLAAYEPYAYNTGNVTWVVDSLTEDNAVGFTIQDTGDQAWHIQLKQNGIHLERGQEYRLTFDVRCNIDRKLLYAIQRDGSKHNDDWTPYVEQIVDIGSEWKTVSVEFTMNFDTDPEGVFSISMGAVGGKQIRDQHRILIDNIILEKID